MTQTQIMQHDFSVPTNLSMTQHKSNLSFVSATFLLHIIFIYSELEVDGNNIKRILLLVIIHHLRILPRFHYPRVMLYVPLDHVSKKGRAISLCVTQKVTLYFQMKTKSNFLQGFSKSLQKTSFNFDLLPGQTRINFIKSYGVYFLYFFGAK